MKKGKLLVLPISLVLFNFISGMESNNNSDYDLVPLVNQEGTSNYNELNLASKIKEKLKSTFSRKKETKRSQSLTYEHIPYSVELDNVPLDEELGIEIVTNVPQESEAQLSLLAITAIGDTFPKYMLINSTNYIGDYFHQTLFDRYYDDAARDEMVIPNCKTIYGVPNAIISPPNMYSGYGMVTYKNGQSCIIKKEKKVRFITAAGISNDNNTFLRGSYSCAIAPNGKFWIETGIKNLTCDPLSCNVISVKSGKTAKTISACEPISCVAVSPDSDRIAIATRACLEIWSASDNLEVHYPIKEAATALAISPNGNYLVLGTGQGNIQVISWNQATNGLLEGILMNGHTQLVTSVIISADNALIVTGSLDGSINFWSLYCNKPIFTKRFSGSIHNLAFGAEGKQLVFELRTKHLFRNVESEINIVDIHAYSSLKKYVTGQSETFKALLLKFWIAQLKKEKCIVDEHDRGIVENALENIPKNMDETLTSFIKKLCRMV